MRKNLKSNQENDKLESEPSNLPRVDDVLRRMLRARPHEVVKAKPTQKQQKKNRISADFIRFVKYIISLEKSAQLAS